MKEYLELLHQTLPPLVDVWAAHSQQSFVLNSKYGVYQTSAGNSTLRNLFGDSWTIKFKAYRGKLAAKHATISHINVDAPSDSVIMLREHKYAVIVASLSEKKVLKCFLRKEDKIYLKKEAQALKLCQGTAAPTLLAEGETQSGGYWILTSFASNSRSFQSELNPKKAFLNAFPTEVLPLLNSYYCKVGFNLITGSDWLKTARTRAENHPSKDRIHSLLDVIQTDVALNEQQFVQSLVHGDLHENNVLRGNESCSLIDWESQENRLILLDVFEPYARRLQEQSLLKRLFYKKLSNKKVNLSFERYFSSFRSWQTSSFNVTASASPHTYFLIYIVERILARYETGGLDRFYRKGMEWKVWEAVTSHRGSTG